MTHLYKTPAPNYSGNRIPVCAQVNIPLEVDGQRIDTLVYVLPDANPSCLLRLNASIGLGLVKFHPSVQVHGVSSAPTLEERITTVRLLTTQSIPAGCGVFLDVCMEGFYQPGEPILFEPAQELLDKKGVVFQDGVLLPNSAGLCRVLAMNESDFDVLLNSHETVGLVTECSLVDDDEDDKETGNNTETSQTVNNLTTSASGAQSSEESIADRQERLAEMVDMSASALSPEQVAEVTQWLLQHHDIFALDESDLGRTSLVEHDIYTGDHPPIRQLPRREAFALRPVIRKMVQDMLKQGIVRPSNSPWASPIVLVKKRNGRYRFCVDYRRLNAVTRKDVFSLPRVDDLIDSLHGATIFSCLDEASGYWQVPIHESRQVQVLC